MTAIELSQKEAAAFIVFLKHREMFSAIVEANLHELKRGEATLRFNHDGVLMDIEIRQLAYKRKTGI